MCGDPIGPGRRRYCGQGCNDLRYFIFGNSRWKAWQIARDTFGDDIAPSCFQCGLTSIEAAYLHEAEGRMAWLPLELDHVVPLWSLTPEERTQHRWWLPGNMQLLCHWCHAAKTKVEARERALAGRIPVGREVGKLAGLSDAEIDAWEALVRAQVKAPRGAAFPRGSLS